jgi:hypothetical protein
MEMIHTLLLAQESLTVINFERKVELKDTLRR